MNKNLIWASLGILGIIGSIIMLKPTLTGNVTGGSIGVTSYLGLILLIAGFFALFMSGRDVYNSTDEFRLSREDQRVMTKAYGPSFRNYSEKVEEEIREIIEGNRQGSKLINKPRILKTLGIDEPLIIFDAKIPNRMLGQKRTGTERYALTLKREYAGILTFLESEGNDRFKWKCRKQD